ncbi:sterol regulatory element-binding protein cleavage-activating protein [Parasteatoda tepidariorum]|uniref:sterol regulatory element-binding protein cleavage-activating protein n=1 Tax=Parasteatoda tepidariorum TaxID=114398 RepID=UPI00077FBDFC|nr:sterol regulatory element-binding protein cleavage-activating protein [Parasteatoda tepidariorum]
MDGTFRMKSYTADIHDKIARAYYSHGLFCSSHPYLVIFVTLIIFLICCYPLIYLPLLGSSSQHFFTPIQGFVPPDINLGNSENYKFNGPRWFQGPPVSYIQQIVVKSALSPWKTDLILTDAFRAPLSTAFQIIQLLQNHQLNPSTVNQTSLGDLCLQVSEPIDHPTSDFLPHYGCLIVSPSSIWQNNIDKFKEDPDIVKTIFGVKDSSVDSSSLREVLFGVPVRETGIKKLFVRNRPRIITYAVTIAFQTYNSKYLTSLHDHIKLKFPKHPYPENVTYASEDKAIIHIHFQSLHTLMEFVPLAFAYIIMFFYIYFSACKIELVKSKWILAICAVMTVFMSLLMSVGICLWFGLNPALSGSEILPYLIVVIGLENILVLTKSVDSTPMHLDVKLRVAQGLSKEGWSITKNLLTELALLTVAFLTFVPKIQEFCLLAVVGLLTDFFLQLMFFATVLSVDLRRLEVTDLQRNCIREVSSIRSNQSGRTTDDKNIRMSHLRFVQVNNDVNISLKPPNTSAKIFAPPAVPTLGKLSKRMKFIYFWARTRMVQRGLMICLVLWIFLLVYSSGIVERYTGNSTLVSKQVLNPLLSKISPRFNSTLLNSNETNENKAWNCSDQTVKEFARNIDIRLKHHNLNSWQSLYPQHWTTLFGYYNISLSGRFISILPPIHVSVAVEPEVAIELRNPKDFEISKKSYWQFLSSGEIKDGDIDDLLSRDLPYHPSSPGEVAIAITLAIPSLLFFIYLMVVLYRCMCSKHYAEWRSSWKNATGSEGNRLGYSDGAADANLVMETFPLKLCGHSQDLEYLCTDEYTVVSTCLDGNINVWDSLSGECLTAIKRSGVSEKANRSSRKHGSFSSDSTYSSSPQSDNGDHLNSYKSFNTDSRTSFPDSSNCNFPKHFSFDKNTAYCDKIGSSSQRYDFSRFVLKEDCISNDAVFDSNDCNKAHEYQNAKDSHLEYINKGTNIVHSTLSHQAIWCMDYYVPCIAVGCKNGRIEVWNAFTGKLEYIYEENKSGITALCLTRERLIAARENGILEFFAIDTLYENYSNLQMHAGHAISLDQMEAAEVIRCSWLQNVKAHSLSISALEVDGMLAISGSYDRLIKIFRTDSTVCIYTLHGHTGPISILNIDQFSPSSAASGCQDGLICLWDLMTGTCMYSLKGHHGSVTTLLTTDIYVISQGTDNQICIWEKSQGHLIHSIVQDYSLHSNLMLLTNNIMVTTKEDNLVIWDVNHGEALRMIMVGSGDHSVHIRLLRLSGQSVICDYGPQIFIINFPAISDKSE